MKMSVSKRSILALCCLSLVSFASVQAQPSTRVLVLPFEIYSESPQPDLKEQLSGLIEKFLSEDGATIVSSQGIPSNLSPGGKPNVQQLRELATSKNADAVIWGSMTRVGDRYSIDAVMVKPADKKPQSVYSVDGKGIENLPADLKLLTRDIGFGLFKREKVVAVQVKGNQRIETDAIMEKIKTAPGDVYLEKTLSEDLKAIYAMGYFDDVKVETEPGQGGKVIIFELKEKPTVRKIVLEGNHVFSNEDILKAVDIKTGSILNDFKINANVKQIENLYLDKNYHNVKVSYKVSDLENNQGDLTFSINEGEKVHIKQITFEGNHAFDDKTLKKQMKTGEKGFFSWLTSSGELKKEDLNQDAVKLGNFYHNHGYIDARISDPNVEITENAINISFKINEGDRFEVGKVDVSGDFIVPKEDLLKKIKISKETYFNREVVRNDVLVLTDVYSDEGFAFAEIVPKVQPEADQKKVDIDYVINKGKLVYFETIEILGNTKTRDKIIRRELPIHEKDVYSGKKLKRGVRNLYRLDYFEDVKVETEKGSADDQMDLKIQVKEKPTGNFSFGGGYSSVERFFVTGSVAERNLFGRGDTLQFRGDVGDVTKRYTISFTEPWLFDIPLSTGFDLYKWDREYTTYDKDSTGGILRFGYPVFDFTRFYLAYTYDVADVQDIDDDAAKSIKELEGKNVTSSVTGTLRYDSRDRVFNPTQGTDDSISVEYAGLGGDIAFIKVTGDAGVYFPLGFGITGFLHGRGGQVEDRPGEGILPDYERFYLGGMHSLRGFKYEDIHAVDEDGAEIGGNKFIQFNAEIIFPLLKDAGVMGVVFYDTGNVYGENDDFDLGSLRKSAGFGIRWYSPMGPIRLENGYILDPEEGEDRNGRWEFTMGTVF
jgi:outer membrane protein insertion porin family